MNVTVCPASTKPLPVAVPTTPLPTMKILANRCSLISGRAKVDAGDGVPTLLPGRRNQEEVSDERAAAGPRWQLIRAADVDVDEARPTVRGLADGG